MARVLFVNAGSEGHINPTIGVVQELVSRGEEIVYICIEAFRERMEQAGATVLTFDSQRFLKAFLAGGRTYLLERINGLLYTADVIIPDILERIRGEHFDYMIHDSMFGCGELLAQILKLPAVCSCSSFVETEASIGRQLERFHSEVPALTADPIKETYCSLVSQVMEKYQVRIRSPYQVFCNPAPLTIIYTTKEFQPDGLSYDSSYKFVGPSIAPRLLQPSAGCEAPRGETLIYISLGTVFNQSSSFYQLCFEALKSSDYSVMMSVGSRTPIADLGEIPGNFTVRNYVNQPDILRHTRLFITHGGMNSTHEGLYYGVPLVVIPQGADQPLIAGQVAKLGAGVVLSMPSLSAQLLREAVKQVLSRSSYRKAAEQMGENLRQAGGYRQAVDEIFAFLQRGN